MKIIVASDLHLSPPQSRIGGWDSRRGSYASWLEPNDRLGEIVDYANANGTDAILIGGDMFDSGSVQSLGFTAPRLRRTLAITPESTRSPRSMVSST